MKKPLNLNSFRRCTCTPNPPNTAMFAPPKALHVHRLKELILKNIKRIQNESRYAREDDRYDVKKQRKSEHKRGTRSPKISGQSSRTKHLGSLFEVQDTTTYKTKRSIKMRRIQELGQEARVAIENLEYARTLLRETIEKELNHSKASEINIELVKKLKVVDEIIRDNL